MSRSMDPGSFRWLVILGLLGIAAYFQGFGIKYYADDFQWFFDPPPPDAWYFFFHRNPHIHNAYRPLQAAFLITVQHFSGLQTLPIHLTQTAVHVLLSFLVYEWMIRRGLGTVQAMIGSLWMLLSQANAMAVLSNDTISQVSGPFFGVLALWGLERFLSRPGGAVEEVGPAGPGLRDPGRGAGEPTGRPLARINPPAAGQYVLSLASFLLALLSKETSTSFFPMIALLVLAKSSPRRTLGRRAATAVAQILPFALVMILYLAARGALGLERFAFGRGRYDLNLGPNVLRNFGLFAIQATTPLSSATAFEAIARRQLAVLALLGLGSLAVLGAAGYGAWLFGRRSLLAWLAGFSVLALFPVVLMNGVSELYLYNAMPFLAVVVGVGIGTLLVRHGATAPGRFVGIGLVVILLLCHVVAVRGKALMMKDCGDRAAVVLEGIKPFLGDVPERGVLLLKNSPDDRVEYSVFLMSDFSVLATGLHRVKEIAGRSDFTVRIIGPSDPWALEPPRGAMILSLDRHTGRVYRAPGPAAVGS